MTTTNLNIRTDREIKEEAEDIYANLGLNMTTAINMFLRASIRENGIPFDLKLKTLDEETIKAIEEARKIARNNNYESFNSIEELRKSLEI